MNIGVLMDAMWILICSVLIFLMQPGFAMLEAGLTRRKHAGNIVMKNLMDFCISVLCFFCLGYGILMGKGSLYGLSGSGLWLSGSGEVSPIVHLIFQLMYCGTAATIVSGALAGRARFSAYLIYCIVLSALIYPVEAHWIWGGGWLSQFTIGSAVGFTDNAGGAVVHICGGAAAMAGCMTIGPRIGKYGKDGKPNAITGHSIVLASLGVFLLWFGWLGFNAIGGRGISSPESLTTTASILMNTILCASASTVAAMLTTWIRYGKPDITMTLNGVLCGLVSSTAGCAEYTPGAAVLVGLLSSLVLVFGVELLENHLRLDDPVGAITVHGFCGTFGVLMVGIFSKKDGLLTTGYADRLLVQIIGAAAVWIFVFGTMYLLFKVLKSTVGLRVSRADEIQGLDMAEHGFRSEGGGELEGLENRILDGETEEKTIVQKIPERSGLAVQYEEMTSIVVICKEERLEALKKALNRIGVLGITVSRAAGCGVQRGDVDNFYRSSVITMHLLPKIRVEVVVSKIPVDLVIDTIRSVLYTGSVGDGKIFVYDVRNVIKVRTGEEGPKALQDPESDSELDME